MDVTIFQKQSVCRIVTILWKEDDEYKIIFKCNTKSEQY